MNLEVVNWKQLMVNKHDIILEADLGDSLPADTNPSQTYSGSAFIKVFTPLTQVEKGEALTLKVIAMEVSNSALTYRALGTTLWNTINLTNIGPSAHEVTIPTHEDDYEYCIESRDIQYPASDKNIL
jgi:hypothetical protein